MGIKRLGRKRLAAIEKLGILKDIGISPVMKNALVSATQHREGQKITTDIVLDLGAAAAGLKTHSIAVDDPIGDVASGDNDSYICKVDQSVFGIVTTVETTCLEVFSDGTMDNIDLIYATSADGFLGSDPGTGKASFTGNAQEDIMDTLGKVTTTAIDNSLLDTNGSSGKYLYLVAGVKTDKRASCEIDCTGVDVAKLVTGMNAIQLLEEDGATKAKFVFDSSLPWDTSAGTYGSNAGKIGIGNSVGDGGTLAAVGAKGLAFAVATAINKHDSGNHFSTPSTNRTVTGGGGSNNGATENDPKIAVTRANTSPTATENTANILVDAYEASGITITDFSGGLPHSIASGKLLIRITGFVAFDDL